MALCTAALIPLACRPPSSATDSRQIVITPPPGPTPVVGASNGTSGSATPTPGPAPTDPGRTPPPTPEPTRQVNLWIEVLVDDTPGETRLVVVPADAPSASTRIQALSATDLSVDWAFEAPGPVPDERSGNMKPAATTGLAATLLEGMYPGVGTASVALRSDAGTIGTATATTSLASGRNNVLRFALSSSGEMRVDLSGDLPWPTPDVRLTVRP